MSTSTQAPEGAQDLRGCTLRIAVTSGVIGLAACGCIMTWHQPVALLACTVVLALAQAGGAK